MSNDTAARRVVVAGFGPVGRAVTQGLEGAGLEVTIVDLNAQTIATQQRLGKDAVRGDISEPAVLEQARVTGADALILTIPDEESSLRACSQVRQAAPDIFIAIRTNHVSNAMRARQAGADHVTIEEIITAESMQQAVMRKLVAGHDNPDE